MWHKSVGNSDHAVTLNLEAYGDDTPASSETEESNVESGEEDGSVSPVQNSSRKRKRSEDENEEDSEILENVESDTPDVVHQMEAEIERQLDAKAKKSNLTVANVKNIIKNVITNEHVLELVRHTMKQSESNYCVNTVLSFTPKLTRSKTKELLNTFPSMAWPLTPSKNISNSECKVLIEEELPEDSSDEEYRPDDDQDVENMKSESDIYDDHNGEVEEQDESDADNVEDEDDDDDFDDDEEDTEDMVEGDDSRHELKEGSSKKHDLSTSNSTMKSCDISKDNGTEDRDDDDDDDDDDDECRLVICDNDDSNKNSDTDSNVKLSSSVKVNDEKERDGNVRNLPKSSEEIIGNEVMQNTLSSQNAVHPPLALEENICQRTRSKLCLSDTPLETIESAFMPPDITTDMYDSECDDENWKNFLKGFTEPLKLNVPDDDEETDPEYNVMAEEEDTEDKEELREDPGVMVSQREVHALMVELFEYSGMLFEEPEDKKKHNLKDNGFTYHNKCNDDELDDIAKQIAGALEQHSEETKSNEQTNAEQPNIPEKKSLPVPDTISLRRSLDNFEYPPVNLSCQSTTSNLCEEINSVTNKTYVAVAKMSKEQILLLQQHMRKHIQLLTQHFLLTYLHPLLHVYAIDCKQYLTILKLLSKNNTESKYYAENLDEGLVLIERWEELYSSEAAKEEYIKAIDKEIEIENVMKIKRKKYTYQRKFPTGFCEVIINSTVFLYPSLLPVIPLTSDGLNTSQFFPSEDNLIALGLELFINLAKKHPKVWGKASLYKVVPMIVEHYTPARKASAVYNHIMECSDKDQYNPIKYYLDNNCAPRTIHYVLPYEIILKPPIEQPLELLPKFWKNYMLCEKSVHR